MGRGSRHSKNAGTMGSEALTHKERRAMGHGTVRQRLGRESLGDFDHCQLSQAPAQDPVCTPSGHLYDREAVLRYILARKKANRQALAAWQAEQGARGVEASSKEAERAAAELREFARANGGSGAGPARAAEGARGEARSAHTSHWIPAKTPEGAAEVGARPPQDVRCPVSGKRLRVKDLIAVRFTRAEDAEGVQVAPGRHRPGGGGRYMDPLTRETLTNRDTLVVLRTTGDVLKRSTYERAVKPDGVYNGKKVAERDVISLQKGGTGFAAHDGDALEASKHFAVGMGSSRADQRGQGGSAGSKFGLKFGN